MTDLPSNSDEFQRFAWHYAAFRAGFRRNTESGKSRKPMYNKAIDLHGVGFEDSRRMLPAACTNCADACTYLGVV